MIENLIEDIDFDEYIINLIIFVNNYCKYEQIYIQEKYNLKSYRSYRIFFKKNYKKILLFNSSKA